MWFIDFLLIGTIGGMRRTSEKGKRRCAKRKNAKKCSFFPFSYKKLENSYSPPREEYNTRDKLKERAENKKMKKKKKKAETYSNSQLSTYSQIPRNSTDNTDKCHTKMYFY